MRWTSSVVAAFLLMGCAGGATTPAMKPDGLEDGATLAAPLEIPAGTTATIPSGAKIVAAPGVTITVRGVLTIASAGAHARIAAAQPDGTHAWGGIVVESGGRLDADGLELAGAATALDR